MNTNKKEISDFLVGTKSIVCRPKIPQNFLEAPMGKIFNDDVADGGHVLGVYLYSSLVQIMAPTFTCGQQRYVRL